MTDYTPPVGDKVALNFTGGPYTPPVGDKVALDFGSGVLPPGDDQYLFPAAWLSEGYGTPLLTGTRITPTGFYGGAFPNPTIANLAKAAYPGGIAPPPSTGTNEFRQVPSPWISFWTRTLDLNAPSRGIAAPAWPTTHVIAFEIQFIDHAGRGSNTMVFGTPRVEFSSRTVYPVSISSMVFGTSLIARVQVIQPTGWANAQQFGSHQLDINLQRVLLVGYSIAPPAITDQHGVRNQFEYTRPLGWHSLQFNFPVVYNLKQEVFVQPYANNAEPTSWPPYAPTVENKIRYVRPSGWMSSRFSVIGTLVENGARALYASGWDGFATGPGSFIAHRNRSVGASGWDSFYSTQFHVIYNNAKLLRPTGWMDSAFGSLSEVLNRNRTVKHHSGPADAYYGLPFVAPRVRYLLQRPFNDQAFPIHEIRLNPYPLKPAGIAPPPTTAPYVYEHFNILRPASANVHSVPWVGEPFIRNRNQTVAVYPSEQSLYGRPTVFNYNTNLTGFTAGDLARYGATLISYRTKTLVPAPISVPVFPVLHRIRNDAPDPPAQQVVVVPSTNVNGNGTVGVVPAPVLNYQSVFPTGFLSESFGATFARGNSIKVESMVTVDQIGRPTMIAAQYLYPQSLPLSTNVVPGTTIPAGDSDSYWTKNLNPGYEWPRLSPHTVYAPQGDRTYGLAILNNPPFPEPSYHAIDGQMSPGYANSRNPFFGETWISLKHRAIGPAPNHSNPNNDKLSPSSVVGTGASVILKQRRIYPDGIRSNRYGLVVLWGVPQYVTLATDNNGIPPGDAYIRQPNGTMVPPSIHTVFFKPLFNRPVYPAGTNMLTVGAHEVQNFNREVLPQGIPHRGNPQQGFTTPWGTALVGYPRTYGWGGYDFTLWGMAWVSHYTRYLLSEGWRSSTLEDYPISGFNDRTRVRPVPARVYPSSAGDSFRAGVPELTRGVREITGRGISAYNAGQPVVLARCQVLPVGWDSADFGDIDRWEAGKVKPHGDDVSAVGYPKLLHPLGPPGADDGGIGAVRVAGVIGTSGMPPVGFDGPSVTDPFGCSLRTITTHPILSTQTVPSPVVTA